MNASGFDSIRYGIRASSEDRAPLLPDRSDIPPELLEMMDDDTTRDLNGTRDKQRAIKAVQKQEHHAAKASGMYMYLSCML